MNKIQTQGESRKWAYISAFSLMFYAVMQFLMNGICVLLILSVFVCVPLCRWTLVLPRRWCAVRKPTHLWALLSTWPQRSSRIRVMTLRLTFGPLASWFMSYWWEGNTLTLKLQLHSFGNKHLKTADFYCSYKTSLYSYMINKKKIFTLVSEIGWSEDKSWISVLASRWQQGNVTDICSTQCLQSQAQVTQQQLIDFTCQHSSLASFQPSLFKFRASENLCQDSGRGAQVPTLLEWSIQVHYQQTVQVKRSSLW